MTLTAEVERDDAVPAPPPPRRNNAWLLIGAGVAMVVLVVVIALALRKGGPDAASPRAVAADRKATCATR